MRLPWSFSCAQRPGSGLRTNSDSRFEHVSRFPDDPKNFQATNVNSARDVSPASVVPASSLTLIGSSNSCRKKIVFPSAFGCQPRKP
jgi:hypothetical protein